MLRSSRLIAMGMLSLGTLGFMGNAACEAGGESDPSPAAAASKEEGRKDIVETAVAAGQFKTLAAALQAAGLVDTLKGEGPFTVFAPTDEAFGKLPKGTVEDLLKPENREKLKAVLTYHVVPARAMAKDVAGMSSAFIHVAICSCWT